MNVFGCIDTFRFQLRRLGAGELFAKAILGEGAPLRGLEIRLDGFDKFVGIPPFPSSKALLAAKLSFKTPKRPLGSAAVTASPGTTEPWSSVFHSSGVKFDLFAILDTPSYSLRYRPWNDELRMIAF